MAKVGTTEGNRLLALLLLTAEGSYSRVEKYAAEYEHLRASLINDPVAMFLPNFVKGAKTLRDAREFIRKISDQPSRRHKFVEQAMQVPLARLKGIVVRPDAVAEYQQFLTEYGGSDLSFAEKASESGRFRKIQSKLMKSKDLWRALPKFAKSQDFLEVCTFLDMVSDTVEDRKEFIMEQFADAREVVEAQRTERPQRSNMPPADLPLFPPPSPSLLASNAVANASTWTGQIGRAEQARHVLLVAPAALEAARQLIEQHEVRLHNGPPESVDAAETLEKLRELYQELGILIEIAEAGGALAHRLDGLRKLWRNVFTWTKDTGELCIAGARPVLASAPLTWGVWALLGAVCEPAVFAAWGPPLAAAVPAGYFGLAAVRQSASAPKKRSNI